LDILTFVTTRKFVFVDDKNLSIMAKICRYTCFTNGLLMTNNPPMNASSVIPYRRIVQICR